MKTGRPRKPTAIKALQGTLRKHRENPAEPMPVGDLDEPPEWMDEQQCASWAYAIQHAPPGLLKLLDRGMLALWCEAECRHRLASMTQSLLNRGSSAPYLVKGPDGMMMSPYVEIIDRAAKIMFRAATEMGFSPAARPRIHLQPEEDFETEGEVNPWNVLRLVPGGKAAG